MDDMRDVMEWTESVNYADSICKQLISEGYDVKYKYYTLDGGRVGLHINLYDIDGSFFREYASGVFKSFKQMKEVLDYIAIKIRLDVNEHNLLCCVAHHEKTGCMDMKEALALIEQKRSIKKLGRDIKNHIINLDSERFRV